MVPRPHSTSLLAALAVVLVPSEGGEAVAADVNGSVQLATTATDNRGLESDLLEQRYNLGLFQDLTPFLGLRLGYQHFDLRTRFEEGVDLSRRTRQPRAELLYNRRRLSGRLAVFEQSIDDTLEAGSFDRRSVAADLSWRPERGPGFSLNFRDDTNVADVSVFGRDVDSRRLELKTFYSWKSVATSYSFERIVVDNRSNELRTDQLRHEVRLDASRGFFTDRIALGFSGRLSRVGRTLEIGAGAEIAEPIPAVAGLVAVDPLPEVGELEPNPTLIDGDFATPASPPVEIGGANTFRNVGLDLGITRPISRLEIGVDTVSGPRVVWQVYRSRDNLLWEPVPQVSVRFDEALLRYVLRFPETEDRFFKAVNVSVNPVPSVFVTEVRALLDLDPADVAPGTEDNDTDLYRADAVLSFRPLERVRGAVGFGLSNDQTVTAGLVQRDFSEVHAFARLGVDLTRSLELDLSYRFDDTEDLRRTLLLRTVEQLDAGLTWRPLETVDALLTAGWRDETEADAPLQSLASVRFALVTQLLPDLRLVSDLERGRLEDAFAGRDRTSWTWRETVEMQPFPRWSLNGGFVWSSNTTPEGETLLRRTQYRIGTTWNATAYLTVGGTLFLIDDGGRRSSNQTFNVSYSPGTRLTVSAAFQGFDSVGDVGTFTDSLSLSYRPYNRFVLFASLSRSRTRVGEDETEISNLRAGIRLSF